MVVASAAAAAYAGKRNGMAMLSSGIPLLSPDPAVSHSITADLSEYRCVTEMLSMAP